MTKQILLKTPRGNTAVIPVDHFVSKAKAGATATSGAKPTLAFSSPGERRTASVLSSSNYCDYPHGHPATTEAEEEAAAIAAALDTSRIFEDEHEYDVDRESKEELLFHLIGASKRRDVGRKRNLRSLYNLEVEGEDDGMEIETEYAHQHPHQNECQTHNNGWSSSDDEKEQTVVATRLHEMDINRDDYYYYSGAGNRRLFKSPRRFYSHSGVRSSSAALVPTSPTPAVRRRQREDPGLARQADRPSQQGSSPPLMVAFYHQGRKVSLDRIWDWITGSSAAKSESGTTDDVGVAGRSNSETASSSSSTPLFPLYLTLSTSARLLGGIDRQNRVGSKFGGGGVSSSQNSERERKERLKQLALESIDLAKDPYLMRNHLGTYECKLCLTLHTNEANYLAHTQGKKHQAGLAKRAHMEKLRKEREEQLADRNNLKRPPPGGRFVCQPATTRKVPRIGRPAYQVFKSKDPDTSQRCLTFELTYKDIETDLQPRHRFMSAFEQRVDLPRDKRYQYVLFAAEPYETIAFKIPNEPLDRDPGRLVTHWDEDDKKFTVTLYFADGKDGGPSNENVTGGSHKEAASMEIDGSAAGTSVFAPALGSH